MAHDKCIERIKKESKAMLLCDCIKDDLEELKLLKKSISNKWIKTKEDCIASWIADFPCEQYFGTKEKCILDYITQKEVYNFIEKKCKRRRK